MENGTLVFIQSYSTFMLIEIDMCVRLYYGISQVLYGNLSNRLIDTVSVGTTKIRWETTQTMIR